MDTGGVSGTMSTMTTTVERLTDDEWERLRDVRIEALTEDGSVFGSSLERESGFRESHWRMRLRASPWFVAGEDGRDVGLVCVISEPGAGPDDRHVVALWVRAVRRGNGIGTALLDAAVDWSRQDGATTVSLWLLEGNEGAAELYRSHGFRPTGISMPLPRDPSRVERRWELSLRPATGELQQEPGGLHRAPAPDPLEPE